MSRPIRTTLVLAVSMAITPATSIASDRTVELRSTGGYNSYRLPSGTRDVELVEQRHGACRFGRTWGFDLTGKELWVNGGCGGLFKLVGQTQASGPEGSNTGAAIAAAVALAGVAILASRHKDDRHDGYTPPPTYPTYPQTYPTYPDRPAGPGYTESGGTAVRGAGGLCLDMMGREVNQGTPAIVYTCNSGRNQRFSWSREGELRVAGMCLDIADRNYQNGARLVAWPCNGGRNQRFSANGSEIRSQQNGKCLDVRTDRPYKQQPVVMWDCRGEPGQHWWW